MGLGPGVSTRPRARLRRSRPGRSGPGGGSAPLGGRRRDPPAQGTRGPRVRFRGDRPEGLPAPVERMTPARRSSQLRGRAPARVDPSPRFELDTELTPQGDQPKAIAELVRRLRAGERFETLLGVTGSGK